MVCVSVLLAVHIVVTDMQVTPVMLYFDDCGLHQYCTIRYIHVQYMYIQIGLSMAHGLERIPIASHKTADYAVCDIMRRYSGNCACADATTVEM